MGVGCRTLIRLSFMGLIVLSLALAAACGGNKTDSEAKAHFEQARTLDQQGNPAAAVEEYTRAIELNQKSDTYFENRGLAYTALGEYDSAIEDFSKAIELAPERGGPVYGRGVAYRLDGDLDKAIADLSKAIGDRNKTKWRAALFERGLAYRSRGTVSEAKADFERILQLEAQNPGEADKEWAERAQKELAGL